MDDFDPKTFAMRACIVVLLVSGIVGAGFCIYTSGRINGRFAELELQAELQQQRTRQLVVEAVAPESAKFQARENELRRWEDRLVDLQRTLQLTQQLMALNDLGAVGGIAELQKKLADVKEGEFDRFLSDYRGVLEAEIAKRKAAEEESHAAGPRKEEHYQRLKRLMDEELQALEDRQRTRSGELEQELSSLRDSREACARGLANETLPPAARQGWADSLAKIEAEVTRVREASEKLSEQSFAKKRELIERYLLQGIKAEQAPTGTGQSEADPSKTGSNLAG